MSIILLLDEKLYAKLIFPLPHRNTLITENVTNFTTMDILRGMRWLFEKLR